MRKAAILILAVIVLTMLVSCSSKPAKTGSQIYIQKVTEDAEPKAVSTTDSDMIQKIVDSSEWMNTQANCNSDYILVMDGNLYYYHTECGSINDIINGKCITVTEDQRNTINSILEKNQ